jgi:integrase
MKLTIYQRFPQLVEWEQTSLETYDGITNFEDIERLFLKGAGLSSNSYRSYLESVRQFYTFTNGKHPLQATAGDVEAFYDDMTARISMPSARLRIDGLKRFFREVEKIVPLFSSPFNGMEKRLVKKLSKTRKGNRQRGALTPDELRALLEWLRQDTSIKGREDYAMIYMLATSGLRSAELLQLG